MNMTTEHSTYTYGDGGQETVTLTRGIATPTGHALLKIKDSSGRIVDCYVNTAWLRDRLGDLGEPCRRTPDAITDEMVERVQQWAVGLRVGGHVYLGSEGAVREMFTAALAEPPARPEGAEDIEALLRRIERAADMPMVADYLARNGVRVVTEERS